MEHKKSDKKFDYLEKIIKSYIETGEPIGSETLKEKYNLNVSSSTIRSIMAQLEKDGYLEKSHISSGRIPSLKAYRYYAKNVESSENQNLEERLNDIFAKRRLSIDKTIDEAAKIITEISGITLVTSTSSIKEKLRSINLTILDENSSVIILVTSSGRVENKTIFFSDEVEKEDIKIAVRVFKERLIDVALNEIQETVKLIAPILAKEIKNLDNVLKTFMQNVFNFKNEIENKIFNKNSLILSKEISREKLTEILELIEKKSIWETIEDKIEEDENLKIKIDSKEAAFISKKIENKEISKEITVVGPTKRMDYSFVLNALNLLEEFLKKEK
ncbi:heat-inducible transcriptional repressor HrcA [Mesomycoplasma lagogenitalium]|uniref:Heat-inducible transcription repressor HrcA n=1 Tax=Mesomycoplasma lagogenitalium TaxID=171286 RepID=A0ABY8LTS0_9BACT|nr:heat-inducible transcriptional repressor HrcA [Mesomycoplasma lagogenitalium]WGI36636.1 heat-inducible transcriptional repressor HrcA [Mesomycoplasma lagogenitalium]